MTRVFFVFQFCSLIICNLSWADVVIERAQKKIIISGVISEDDDNSFERAVEELKLLGVKVDEILIHSSPGGYTKAGLNIGLKILSLKANVRLTGWCFSSCANYIFAAGRIKYLMPGTLADPTVVGFHGSPSATLSYYIEKGYSRNEITDYLLKGSGKSTDRIDLDYVFDNEGDFFRSIGLNTEIFDISVNYERRASHLNCAGGIVPSTFTPTVDQLISFGFTNIVGKTEVFANHRDKDILFCDVR